MLKNFEQTIDFFNSGTERCRIAVFGDVMLDRYYCGEATRIAPEAPVPILDVKQTSNALGGAGNVANNLARLGCRVFLAGVVGKDENAQMLYDLLDAQKIDRSGLLAAYRPTTTKIRAMGVSQQMFRMDIEKTTLLGTQLQQKLKLWFQQLADHGLEAVVISDYSKGVCTKGLCLFVIGECGKRHIPTVVEPKSPFWSKYSRASFITPNIKELGEAVGETLVNEDDAIEMCARVALRRYHLENVLVTRADKGLSVVSSAQTIHVRAQRKEVCDVTGAGDTVTSVLTAALAGGLDHLDVARVANLAASIVLDKIGTYAVSKNNLVHALRNLRGIPQWKRKFMRLDEVLSLIKTWRQEGATIVFTNGCFDTLHPGHVAFLEKSKQLGDRLVVGLNTDVSVRRIKGPTRPIIGEQGRARMLSSLECVDCVVFLDEDVPNHLIRAIRPDILSKGSDYGVDTVLGREYAGRVEIIPLEEEYSTTKILETIFNKFKGAIVKA